MADVEVTRDGAVQTITLNRPEKMNAFTRGMHGELNAALKQARDPEVRAVVITGAGRAFCAGQDLTEFGETGDIGATLRATYHPNVHAVRALEKPVIAAVNGVCAGAGLSLACVCDIRIAADDGELRARLRRHRARSRRGRHVLPQPAARRLARVRVDVVEPPAHRRRGARLGARVRGGRGRRTARRGRPSSQRSTRRCRRGGSA